MSAIQHPGRAQLDTGPQTDELLKTWSSPRGLLGQLSLVDHKIVGQRIIVTGFIFFLLGGLESLLMRIQLGTPENTFLTPEAYNQIFTMHGTTMMFLFATPITEGLGVLLVPLMIGSRDILFPRLNAFGYWAYLFGGIVIYSSFLFGTAPNGGWFAYVPLTGPVYSPGLNLDFWNVGLTIVEISTVSTAIYLIVTILKARAPGMTLSRMPLFVWGILVQGFMIVFAMPPLIMASVMLELDRRVGTRFFDPAAGGDPILWQHLFWIFGHPEVYLIFIPSLGVVSTLVATFARKRIFGYTYVALSTVAIGFASFALWVHHMFATGLADLGLSFFTAASMMLAIPSGVQFFCWIATLWRSRLVISTPFLYVIGFFFIFLIGGVTGVMVASAPFDLQATDSYFVVAHLHYVLIGGVVFPLFGAFFYWFPKFTGRLMSEGLGKWAFWLTFIGFNVTFFPMHLSGLFGMPRRVYTYLPDMNLGPLNLLSTIGAFILAVGILLFLWNVYRGLRFGAAAGPNPWNAPTLEWAVASPPPPYNFARIPQTRSAYPLWDTAGAIAPGRARADDGHSEDGQIQERTERQNEGQTAGPGNGHMAFPAVTTAVPSAIALRSDRPETLVTSALDASPTHRVVLAEPSIWPFVAAIGVTILWVGWMISLTVIALGVVITIFSLLGWIWPETTLKGTDA